MLLQDILDSHLLDTSHRFALCECLAESDLLTRQLLRAELHVVDQPVGDVQSPGPSGGSSMWMTLMR
jgi:hypothetical protein